MMPLPPGGGMPPGSMGPPPPAPMGAYAGMQQAMNDYIGFPEIDDILGVGQEQDALIAAEEAGGELMPLSSYGTGNEGVYGGSAGMGMGSMGPMDMPGDMPMGMPGGEMDSDAASGMRDLLAERAKSRLGASEAFQSKASSML